MLLAGLFLHLQLILHKSGHQNFDHLDSDLDCQTIGDMISMLVLVYHNLLHTRTRFGVKSLNMVWYYVIPYLSDITASPTATLPSWCAGQTSLAAHSTCMLRPVRRKRKVSTCTNKRLQCSAEANRTINLAVARSLLLNIVMTGCT